MKTNNFLRWREFTDIEIIMGLFLTILGATVHILTGIIMFGLFMLIHTMSYLIWRWSNKK